MRHPTLAGAKAAPHFDTVRDHYRCETPGRACALPGSSSPGAVPKQWTVGLCDGAI